jgi:hypothetical protein
MDIYSIGMLIDSAGMNKRNAGMLIYNKRMTIYSAGLIRRANGKPLGHRVKALILQTPRFKTPRFHLLRGPAMVCATPWRNAEGVLSTSPGLRRCAPSSCGGGETPKVFYQPAQGWRDSESAYPGNPPQKNHEL